MHYEFERAASAFEQIIARDPEDAEARFCLALCRYGVEYVRDPRSGEYKPTCHRASFQPFLEDVDYQAALKYATVQAQEEYRRRGAEIHEILQHAIEIARYEDPYDVFLCYKESPGAGSEPAMRGGGSERTKDSVLAQELYEELTRRGARVFFSRITLEKKLGSAYEPYIFAALQSARVMLVVGTRREYLESIWVKNEWQRYLHLRQSDHSREVIPVLEGMEDYDLPDELAEFIPLHTDETGVKQDLIRGVLKIIGQTENTTEKLQKRDLEKQADRFLAAGDMAAAEEIAEQMLNLDPDSMAAYRIRFLVSQKAASLEDCRELDRNFEEAPAFLQLQRYAGGDLKRRIDELLRYRQKREIYKQGQKCLRDGEFEAAYEAFLQSDDYKDAAKLAAKCAAKAAGQKQERELEENIAKYRKEVESAKESVEREWARLSPETAARKNQLDGMKWRQKRPDLPMAAGSIVTFGMALISLNFQKDAAGAPVMSAVLIGVVAFYLFYIMCILMKWFSTELSFFLMILSGLGGAAFATAIVTAGVKTLAGKLDMGPDDGALTWRRRWRRMRIRASLPVWEWGLE